MRAARTCYDVIHACFERRRACLVATIGTFSVVSACTRLNQLTCRRMDVRVRSFFSFLRHFCRASLTMCYIHCPLAVITDLDWSINVRCASAAMWIVRRFSAVAAFHGRSSHDVVNFYRLTYRFLKAVVLCVCQYRQRVKLKACPHLFPKQAILLPFRFGRL